MPHQRGPSEALFSTTTGTEQLAYAGFVGKSKP